MKHFTILTTSFLSFGFLSLEQAKAIRASTSNATNSTGLQTAPTQPSSATSTTPTNIGTTPTANETNTTQPGTTGEISQTELVTRVRQDLMNDTGLSSAASSITIENANGQITLRGTVPNQQTQQDLISRVSRIGGVSSVNNQLTISNTQNR